MISLRPQVLALRVAVGSIVCVGLAASPIEASAQAPAEPAKLKAAAESFESGAKAFKDQRFEEAAAHFESADEAVPSAKALRLAIRSRKEAGQRSRAAYLAALALERYPDDPDTKTLASDVVLELGGGLHRVDVSCVSPCVLAVSNEAGRSRVVHGTPTTRWTVFVEPGFPLLAASFVVGDLKAPEQKIGAKAGGSSALRFVPEGGAQPTPTNPPPDATGPTSAPPEGGAPLAPEAEPGPDGSASLQGAADSSGGGLSPVFFFVGLAATAGLGGVTVWSGVDTQNDPGPDAVRAACAGQGTECPAYQDGQAKELRTNVLIGATAGAAVLTTAVGLFLTDWGGAGEPGADAATARFSVDVLGAPPSGADAPRVGGFIAHLSGRF